LYVNCGDCDELYSKGCLVEDFNWITDKMTEDFTCNVKLRYRQPDQKTKVVFKNGEMHLEFNEKQRAVTPGQFAVLYAEDGMCLGGGRIKEIY